MGKNLEGKVAVVAGSGQGIGRAIAMHLAKEGAKIVTNNRKKGSTGYAFITEENLMDVSSRVFNTPMMNVDELNPKLAELIPYEAAMRLGVVPISQKDDTLNVAMSDPLDIMAIDEIKIITGMSVKPFLATKSKINELAENFYHSDEQLYGLLKIGKCLSEIIRSVS